MRRWASTKKKETIQNELKRDYWTRQKKPKNDQQKILSVLGKADGTKSAKPKK